MELRAELISKTYGRRQVVQSVSLRVQRGEIVGLLGPNGAGKTTCFYMLVGLVQPDSGKVMLDDKDLTHLPMFERARLGLGYLPQEASIFRKLSVEDNIRAVLELTDLDREAQNQKAESLLAEFNLERVRKTRGDLLSGGERRRTEMARALATDPAFMLLDEPFAGVDPIAVEDIQKIIFALKRRNIGVLITDHNVQETLSITDQATLLFEGKILRQGSTEDMAQDPEVRRLYLGKSFEFKRKSFESDTVL
ncbi:MAG: LPS export ABC transporter ATP-binding protein [Bacteroidia bacterium]|jgi:lipopolysaccharide export system ATP-binding protein